MYEPVKYKRLKEIITELKVHLDAIDSGKLSREELENAAELGRELYERLVVIRFKAYDSLVKGEEKPTVTKAEEAVPISFKVPESKPEISPNQISLIDAIEELTPVVEVKVPEAKVIAPALIVPPPTPAPPKPPSESLHDRLSKDIPKQESLSEKIEHSPIQDLKKAISLNQRFQFSKELFKGNNQEYEIAIDKLNNTSREEALRHMDSLRSKFSWTAESDVVHDFTELVERRHS